MQPLLQHIQRLNTPPSAQRKFIGEQPKLEQIFACGSILLGLAKFCQDALARRIYCAWLFQQNH
jgi:hypothetical protein